MSSIEARRKDTPTRITRSAPNQSVATAAKGLSSAAVNMVSEKVRAMCDGSYPLSLYKGVMMTPNP